MDAERWSTPKIDRAVEHILILARLLEVVRRAGVPALAANLAREYLTARILLAMQDAGATIPLAFQGGTALRVSLRLRVLTRSRLVPPKAWADAYIAAELS